jgi:hypothetical protein
VPMSVSYPFANIGELKELAGMCQLPGISRHPGVGSERDNSALPVRSLVQ